MSNLDDVCREHRRRWYAHAGPIERAWGRYVMPSGSLVTIAYFALRALGGA